MTAPLDENFTLPGKDCLFFLIDTDVAKHDDTGVWTVGVLLRQHLAVCVQSITVIHRRAKADLVEAKLRERLLRRVFGREPDDERRCDAAEGDAVLERALAHPVLVEMALRCIHDEVRDHHVVHLVYGAPTRVLVDGAYGEVFKVVVLTGQTRHAAFHFLISPSRRSE